MIHESFKMMVADYSATGEGLSVCILIKRNGTEEALTERFIEIFGDFYAIGAEMITDEKMREFYSSFVPEKFLEEKRVQYCSFEWFSQYHINCS